MRARASARGVLRRMGKPGGLAKKLARREGTTSGARKPRRGLRSGRRAHLCCAPVGAAGAGLVGGIEAAVAVAVERSPSVLSVAKPVAHNKTHKTGKA